MATLDLPEAGRLVGEDIGYQRRTWRVQRVGWAVMVLFVLLAVSGGLGVGPLANGHARSGDGVLEAEWERIQRLGRDARLVLRTREAGRITLEGDVAEGLDFIRVDPPGAVVARGPGRVVLEVRDAPGEVVLRTQTDTPAILSGTLSDGRRSLPLRIVVLP